MLAVETLWDSGEHSYVQKEISAVGGGSTRGREVLGPTLAGGFPGGHSWGAAAYPVSSLCRSIQGSIGRSHRWGCRSHCWHRSRAGHSPAQNALQHTLWAQDSLAPALPLALLRPPPTATRLVPGHSRGPGGAMDQVGAAYLSTPISTAVSSSSCPRSCLLPDRL